VKVGVLVAMGYPKAHIARMLDVHDLVVPLQRLKRVAPSGIATVTVAEPGASCVGSRRPRGH
jgi:hypothetical protein